MAGPFAIWKDDQTTEFEKLHFLSEIDDLLPLVKNYSVYDDEIVPILSRLEIPTLDILPVFPIH
jgi:hypothetical protein